MRANVFKIALVLLLVGAVAYVTVQMGNARMQQHMLECRARYATARNAIDTGIVDGRLLPNPGSRVQLWHSCGQYRRSGKL